MSQPTNFERLPPPGLAMARLASKTGWRAPRLYPESDGAQISFMPLV